MPTVSPIFNSFERIAATQPKKVLHKYSSTNIDESTTISKIRRIKDKTIMSALLELNDVKFDQYDTAYMATLGVQSSFNSGNEVINFLLDKSVKIGFGKTSVKGTFAQYNYQENSIIINHEYKNPKTRADILAISEAIAHEAGHAKDGDYDNSVQEEINNLALNVLCHRFYIRRYPHAFEHSKSPLVTNGVNLYSNLFYDIDPEKKGLVKRLRDKYGYLPTSDLLHPATYISMKVKEDENIKKQIT